MSEIRTRLQGGTPFFPNMLNNGNVEVCLKEDVDKVLAEKDKEIAELKDGVVYWKKVAKKNMDDNVVMAKQRAEALKRGRHNKYKRCLAMAKWCENAILGWMGYKESYSSHQRYIKVMLFTKWNKRWLELAEKFREAK